VAFVPSPIVLGLTQELPRFGHGMRDLLLFCGTSRHENPLSNRRRRSGQPDGHEVARLPSRTPGQGFQSPGYAALVTERMQGAEGF
jgi:hypothetical protein